MAFPCGSDALQRTRAGTQGYCRLHEGPGDWPCPTTRFSQRRRVRRTRASRTSTSLRARRDDVTADALHGLLVVRSRWRRDGRHCGRQHHRSGEKHADAASPGRSRRDRLDPHRTRCCHVDRCSFKGASVGDPLAEQGSRALGSVRSERCSGRANSERHLL